MLGGLVSAGLGLASSIFGKKSRDKEVGYANQGFDYLRDNRLVDEAQAGARDALGAESDALGFKHAYAF